MGLNYKIRLQFYPLVEVLGIVQYSLSWFGDYAWYSFFKSSSNNFQIYAIYDNSFSNTCLYITNTASPFDLKIFRPTICSMCTSLVGYSEIIFFLFLIKQWYEWPYWTAKMLSIMTSRAHFVRRTSLDDRIYERRWLDFF